MIGIIVTGHSGFATGLTSSLKLLAGEPECYYAVDFLPEDSKDILTEKIRGAMEQLKNCEGILILADLTGGSPYNVSTRLRMEGTYQMEIIGGVNLGAVIEAVMGRMTVNDVKELACSVTKAAREQVVHFLTGEEKAALKREKAQQAAPCVPDQF